MRTVTWLTVSAGKRLIAKGIAAHPAVRKALDSGTVVITHGTTNAFIAQEVVDAAFERSRFVTGHAKPADYDGPKLSSELPAVVLKDGNREDVALDDVVPELGPGDVVLKGANALNYELQQAAVLIGHPQGGTLATLLGRIVAGRVTLIHPCGLEKAVPGDLDDTAAILAEPDGRGPTLWVSPGSVFTELEALEALCDVSAIPVAAGGIGGAEGACWLAVHGEKTALDQAEAFLDSVRGEPAFPGRSSTS